MNPRQFLKDNGYASLTEPYLIPEQTEILEGALRSLRKGGRNYFLLEEEDTMEIFVPACDLRRVDAEDSQ